MVLVLVVDNVARFFVLGGGVRGGKMVLSKALLVEVSVRRLLSE